MSASPADGPVGPVRQRRWSAKVRTGCTTCRTRRVKCDEKRPICGNCSVKSRPCDISGEVLTRKPYSVGSVARMRRPWATAAAKTAAAAQPNLAVQPLNMDRPLLNDLTPSGWDWVEACEYWNTVPLMKTDQDLLLPSDFLRDTTKIPFRPGKTVTVFIMGSIAHNLSRSCRQASTTVETDPSPEVIRMKQKYANYMGEELQQLNRDIANPATYGITGVFSRLIGLIASEMEISSPNLRLHMQGFITLLAVSGGVDKVLERKEANILAIIHIMVSTTVMNTTTPANDMIAGESFFSNQDVYTCYASTLHLGFPCPTHLFLCLRDINRLRQQVVTGEYSPGMIQAACHSVFETIAAFKPAQWQERYEMPKATFRTDLARIFQYAVALYARLTLAKHAGTEYEAEDRIADALRLVGMVSNTQYLIPTMTLSWPLVVAGAALGGARLSAKGKVDWFLFEIAKRSDAQEGPLRALETLREFWVSGKTQWEECFTKWHFPIAG